MKCITAIHCIKPNLPEYWPNATTRSTAKPTPSRDARLTNTQRHTKAQPQQRKLISSSGLPLGDFCQILNPDSIFPFSLIQCHSLLTPSTPSTAERNARRLLRNLPSTVLTRLQTISRQNQLWNHPPPLDRARCRFCDRHSPANLFNRPSAFHLAAFRCPWHVAQRVHELLVWSSVREKARRPDRRCRGENANRR